MSQEEEDVDYMSDSFLNSIDDVKPGIVTTRTVLRQRHVEYNCKRNRTLPVAKQELQQLNDGLNKKVGPDNKGFSLLTKMGYKPGQGLGVDAKGRADPVPVEILSGREGLGFASKKREQIELKRRAQLVRQLEVQSEFRDIMAARFRHSRIQRQLEAARRVCFRLDTHESLEVPINPLFWPLPDTSTEPSERTSCPPTFAKRKQKRSHAAPVLPTSKPVLTNISDSSDDNLDDPCDNEHTKLGYVDSDMNVEDTFAELLAYLRGRHHYCFWCSVQYDNHSELVAECPGLTEDEHI